MIAASKERLQVLKRGSGFSTPANRRCWFQWHPRSNGVKQREASENLVTRLVTGNRVLGHT
jgi:hypothetical protein